MEDDNEVQVQNCPDQQQQRDEKCMISEGITNPGFVNDQSETSTELDPGRIEMDSNISGNKEETGFSKIASKVLLAKKYGRKMLARKDKRYEAYIYIYQLVIRL